jgi:alpha-N-arabinofuranosidase
MRVVKHLAIAVALLLTGPVASFAAAREEAVLSLDLSRPGPAISPYLYGQFIEHLGRCIHDGIWAEKLRDRKFLLALDKSPWQVVGAAGNAYLDAAGAYAGEHCLALWQRGEGAEDCGILQKDIGLIGGKEYVGYAVVSVVSGDPALEAGLSWGEGAAEQHTVPLAGLGREYRRIAFRFKAGGTTESASFSMRLVKSGLVRIGCVSLMPADNVNGMRADVVALIKQLNPPITRWPGGNFVSGYNWKDGIGERDRRPPRWERAWNAVEDNDFGLDEFMRFCAEVRTEPYIAVNGIRDGLKPQPLGSRARAQRAPETLPGHLVGHRQRDVRRLAVGQRARQALCAAPQFFCRRDEGKELQYQDHCRGRAGPLE